MKRNDFFVPHFSLTPSDGRGAGPLPCMELWEHQGTDNLANNYMAWANLFLLTEVVIGWCNAYLNQKLDFGASVHVFSLWKVLRLAKHLQFWNGEWENTWPVFLHIYHKCHTACSSKQAVRFLHWYLGVLAHPFFLPCWSFFLTYRLVFSSTEQRE